MVGNHGSISTIYRCLGWVGGGGGSVSKPFSLMAPMQKIESGPRMQTSPKRPRNAAGSTPSQRHRRKVHKNNGGRGNHQRGRNTFEFGLGNGPRFHYIINRPAKARARTRTTPYGARAPPRWAAHSCAGTPAATKSRFRSASSAGRSAGGGGGAGSRKGGPRNCRPGGRRVAAISAEPGGKEGRPVGRGGRLCGRPNDEHNQPIKMRKLWTAPRPRPQRPVPLQWHGQTKCRPKMGDRGSYPQTLPMFRRRLRHRSHVSHVALVRRIGLGPDRNQSGNNRTSPK